MGRWRLGFLLIGGLMLMAPDVALAQKSFFFDGDFHLQEKRFSLKIGLDNEIPIIFEVARQAENSYQAALRIDHLITPFFGISTVLEGSLELRPQTSYATERLVGKIASKYTLIDGKPIEELAMEFEIRQGKMHISALSVGNLSCSGSVALKAPYHLDLKFHLSSVDLQNFISFFAGSQLVEAEGPVNGDIHVSGSVLAPHLRGNLNSYHGSVDRLPYNSIILNAHGLYPVLFVEQSTVTNAEGLISEISGKVDLSDRPNLKKQIKELVRSPVVTQEGENVEWTLKRMKSDDRSSASTEVKVLNKTDPEDDAKSSSGMLGVEHKVEF